MSIQEKGRRKVLLSSFLIWVLLPVHNLMRFPLFQIPGWVFTHKPGLKLVSGFAIQTVLDNK
jgi:hypothetical protein